MTVKKLNCWELMRCGREPDGENAVRLGVCPAAVDQRFTGTNDGKNAGRYCWRVAGTLCNEEIQGTFAEKALTCCKCEFFLLVVDEEGPEVEL